MEQEDKERLLLGLLPLPRRISQVTGEGLEPVLVRKLVRNAS